MYGSPLEDRDWDNVPDEVDFCDSKTVTTRKDHPCEVCKEIIPAGSPATSVSMKLRGRSQHPERYYQHPMNSQGECVLPNPDPPPADGKCELCGEDHPTSLCDLKLCWTCFEVDTECECGRLVPISAAAWVGLGYPEAIDSDEIRGRTQG